MAEDGKRSENVCAKVSERMLLDVNRICAVEDRTLSEYLYRLIRNDLYGKSERLNEISQSTK